MSLTQRTLNDLEGCLTFAVVHERSNRVSRNVDFVKIEFQLLKKLYISLGGQKAPQNVSRRSFGVYLCLVIFRVVMAT